MVGKQSHSPLPPNPCLVAVILTVSSSAGPRWVFHYPPEPSVVPKVPAGLQLGLDQEDDWADEIGTTADDRGDDERDEDISDDDPIADEDEDEYAEVAAVVGMDDFLSGSRKGPDAGSSQRGRRSWQADVIRKATCRMFRAQRRRRRKRREVPVKPEPDLERDEADFRTISRAPFAAGREDGPTAAWETVLGYPTAELAKLLAPARQFDKIRFELGLGDVVFVGAPRFARPDGRWGRREDVSRHVDGSTRSNEDCNGDMTMFNIVCVLKPAALEYRVRVEEMYTHVTRKLAKLLKWEQAADRFVSSQARDLWELQQKGKDEQLPTAVLWAVILEQSALARAVAAVYSAISTTRIAHVNLAGRLDAYLQIPQPVSTSVMPTAMRPQIDGLWLTTASMSHFGLGDPSADDDGAGQPEFSTGEHVNAGHAVPVDEDGPKEIIDQTTEGPDRPAGTVSPHAAILLLDQPAVLLRQIRQTNPDALTASLAAFVLLVSPTSSLLQLATAGTAAIRVEKAIERVREDGDDEDDPDVLSTATVEAAAELSLREMQLLAQHLIYWRRARAIPPLHPRATYVVSPNCPIHSLGRDAVEFALLFCDSVKPSSSARSGAPEMVVPPLAVLLDRMSGTPEPETYRSIIGPEADRESRRAYMDVLAWLARRGYVTELKTFAWVSVPTSVRRAVAIEAGCELDGEDDDEPIVITAPVRASSREVRWLAKIGELVSQATVLSESSTGSDDSAHSEPEEDGDVDHVDDVDENADDDDEEDDEQEDEIDEQNDDADGYPRRNSVASTGADEAADDDDNTQDYTRPDIHNIITTAITPTPDDGSGRPALGRTLTSDDSSSSSDDTDDSDLSVVDSASISGRHRARPTTLAGSEDAEPDRTPSPQPADMTDAQFNSQLGVAARELWPRLVPYLDGQHALEEVPVREGVSAGLVADVVRLLDREGWLVTYRGW